MNLKPLYENHLETVCAAVADAIEGSKEAGRPFDGVVFHAGTARCYHADDQHIPFRSVFHFLRFVPQDGPDHLLLVRPGETPRLIRVIPRDFWYEPPAEVTHPFLDLLAVEEVTSAREAAECLGPLARHAYVGNDPAMAEALDLPGKAVEPRVLMARLDWHRAYKTPYEVACIQEASQRAARGHAAVRQGFAENRSERDLHAAYLEAAGLLEFDSPYGNIIGWDHHGAILHYQTKESGSPAPGKTLLVDAGAPWLGYASDVTRTYAKPDVHPAFREALDGMDELELALLNSIEVGGSFVELHRKAHRGVARILHQIGILKVKVDEAIEKKLTLPFFPHGLGHHLGLQVHDVGGRLADPDGTVAEPPEDYPSLRTTRTIEAGQVLTIEPGLYFIPMLLDSLRDGEHAGDVNWALVDELTPLGGIRVEDDALVTDQGPENLTRSLMPGHREM
jgi:Xaa-Pro dipeptidase